MTPAESSGVCIFILAIEFARGRIAVEAFAAAQPTLAHDSVEDCAAEKKRPEHDNGKPEVIDHDVPFHS